MPTAAPALGENLRAYDTVAAQRIINLVVDNFEANAIHGVRIEGGLQFSDTLGGFYPFVVNPRGDVTINASNANPSGFSFHNTAAALADELLYLSDGGSMFFQPDTTVSTNTRLIIADRSAADAVTYLGWVFRPAATTGGHTGPEVAIIDPAGTSFTIYSNGYLFTQGASGDDSGIELTDSAGLASLAIDVGPTFDPTVAAFGSNSNINIWIDPKGTGTLGVVYATNALGGGAAATLGTIGGTGPGTAGQNSWLKIKTDTGSVNTYWIPVWQ